MEKELYCIIFSQYISDIKSVHFVLDMTGKGCLKTWQIRASIPIQRYRKGPRVVAPTLNVISFLGECKANYIKARHYLVHIVLQLINTWMYSEHLSLSRGMFIGREWVQHYCMGKNSTHKYYYYKRHSRFCGRGVHIAVIVVNSSHLHHLYSHNNLALRHTQPHWLGGAIYVLESWRAAWRRGSR